MNEGPGAVVYAVSPEEVLGEVALFALLVAVSAAIALWPRLAYWRSALTHREPASLPSDLSPIVAAVVSRLTMTRQLVCGLSWVETADWNAREPGRAEENLIGVVADSSHTRGDGSAVVRVRAMSTLIRTHRELAGEEARDRGLGRDQGRLVMGLRIFAVLQIVASYLMLGVLPVGAKGMSTGAFFSGLVTFWITYHVDPRSAAGARLSVELERLRDRFREAGATASSFDDTGLRSILPRAENAGQLHVWAVAVGCHSQESDRMAEQIRQAAREGINFATISEFVLGTLTAIVKLPYTVYRRARGPEHPPSALLW